MNVLIIEDDPMVEFIHRHYLEQTTYFETIFSANTVEEGSLILNENSIDLILLDIHLKTGNGLTFLKEVRTNSLESEVIIISAAKEARSVKEGFHLGILDYLIKPFSYERFEESIQRFLERKNIFNNSEFQQTTIDHLNQATISQPNTSKTVTLDEKGLSQATYQHVLDTITTFNRAFTIQELTDKSNLSHVSIRKYINFMEENNILTSQQIYTKIGRPYKKYLLNTVK
ncbi:response regulator [Streptococcus thoraltensis]|uniref:response regulator n=1 Tax=Streptococcus thoraltensis TaxID=55085 RepID=UPI00035F1511|nr:response regulator [Streptococcus thoraltensis]MDY4762324.1 response regulator [Streptococcus thoraltensis]